MLQCKVCNREADKNGDYCELHAEAYHSIQRKYAKWKKALDITWEDYLTEILKNPLTGRWAKEVSQQLLKKEEIDEETRTT